MLQLLSLKLMIELELLSIRVFLVKVILKFGQEKYLLSFLKTIPWTCKPKDLNGEKVFIEKELLLTIL